jgi:hypothetical protein
MAFIRWRGNCAQLLATVYQDGRSGQLNLTTLRGHYAHPDERASVAARFPHLQVDWQAVDAALAKGPPAKAAQVPTEHLDWAAIEHQLRELAERARPALPRDAQQLLQAAEVLTWWRAGRPYFLLPEKGGGQSPPAP